MPIDAESAALVAEYQRTGDPAACDRLLRKWNGWIHQKARRTSIKYGLGYEEALQAIRLGMMDAALRFELERETGLLAYVDQWVRPHVARARTESGPLVAPPSWVHSGRQGVMGRTISAMREAGEPITDAAIGTKIGVGTRTVAAMRSMSQISLDSPIGDDPGGSTWHDAIPCKAPGPDVLAERKIDAEKLHARVEEALATIPPRRAEIVRAWIARDCDQGAMVEIAAELGLTRQAVSNAIGLALPVLRQALSGAANAN